MNRLTFIIFIFSGLYAQCDDYNEFNCSNDDSCEWVQNLEIENCHDILDCTGGCTWQDCEAIEGCWWHFGTAYYDPSGCYGEHEADNSYCEEIVMPECSEMSETQSDTNEHCSWVEDVDYIDCDDLSDYNSCNINYDNGCQWILMHWQQQNETNFCTGPTFEVNNSYCYDSESLDCYQMDENQCENNDDCEWYCNTNSNNCNQFNSNLECSNYDECDWTQDSITASCYTNQWESGFANSAECNAIPGCYWDCSDWYSWACDCEGAYQVDISSCVGTYEYESWSCDELQYVSGDVNLDWEINVLDIVELVDIILNGVSYNSIGDTNSDGVNNILDIILLVSIILGD